MNDKVEGFVLSQSDYKEADVLMQVMTREYGIISLVGKAAKKLSSKNHFLPMCVYEFIIDYKEGKTIFSVHGYKLLRKFFDDDNIAMMTFRNILAELVLKNRDIDCYDELLFVFDRLEEGNRYLLGSMFVSYLAKRFGVSPEVDGCVICGNTSVVSVSNRDGGFLCHDHLGGNEALSVERLKKFRMIVKATFDNYDVLKQFDYDSRDFDLILSFFLDNSDLKLKSYELYKALNI